MAILQLDLFGNPIDVSPDKTERAKEQKASMDAVAIQPSETNPLAIPLFEDEGNKEEANVDRELVLPQPQTTSTSDNGETLVYSDSQIRVRLKGRPKGSVKEPEPAKPPAKRGRPQKDETQPANPNRELNVPDEEAMKSKLYWGIAEVAEMFGENKSLIRYWENEFDILKPRKTRKGDRLFRAEDIKNLQLIHHLLRNRKFSIEGAKEYLKANKSQADTHLEITQTLTKFRSFLLGLKTNLGL